MSSSVAQAIDGKTIGGADLHHALETLAALFPRLADDLAKKDWSDLADLGVTEAAALIASVFPRYALIARLVATLAIYARHHPDGVLSPAMTRADGSGGAPTTGFAPTV